MMMMCSNRKHKCRIFIFYYILFTILIYFAALLYGGYLKLNKNMVSARFDKKVISLKMIKLNKEYDELENKKSMPVTAWNMIKSAPISACDYKCTNISQCFIRKGNVNIYNIYGKATDICNFNMLHGNNLIEDDYEGCTIDKNTSYKLFKTEYSVNNTVYFNKKYYTVRGVLDTNHSMMLIQSRNDKEEFDNLEFNCNDVENGYKKVLDFCIQNGIECEPVIIESGFYNILFNKILLIPVYIVLITFMICCAKMLIKYKKVSLKYIVFLIGVLILIISSLYLLKKQIYYPSRLIPSKWSDFDFWVEKYKEFSSAIEQITYVTPVLKDVIMFNQMKIICLCTIITIINEINLIFYLFNTHILSYGEHKNTNI